MRTVSYTLGATLLAVLAVANLWVGAARASWFNLAMAGGCAVAGLYVLSGRTD